MKINSSILFKWLLLSPKELCDHGLCVQLRVSEWTYKNYSNHLITGHTTFEVKSFTTDGKFSNPFTTKYFFQHNTFNCFLCRKEEEYICGVKNC